ncbi:hypothetical protein GY45DRAFT_1359510 [Cubamyces sp. BRFM 1775]|nr:hypothetical protein GY45DRAFT_1359510 [Cubamyces sp. BRFM 1775]
MGRCAAAARDEAARQRRRGRYMRNQKSGAARRDSPKPVGLRARFAQSLDGRIEVVGRDEEVEIDGRKGAMWWEVVVVDGERTGPRLPHPFPPQPIDARPIQQLDSPAPREATRGGSPARTRARTLSNGRRPQSGKRAHDRDMPPDVPNGCVDGVSTVARPRSAEDPPLTAPTGAPARLPRKATEGELPAPRHFPVGVASSILEPRLRRSRAHDPVDLNGRFPASVSAPRGYEPPPLMRSSPKQASAGALLCHFPAQTPKNDKLTTEVIVLWSIRRASILRYLHGPSGPSRS